MYISFEFDDHSNPYITTANYKLFEMLKKYNCTQRGARSFRVHGRNQILTATPGKLTPYKKNKAVAREIAIQWQYDFENMRYDWGDLAAWGDFFQYLGERFGLLEEFRENGII